MSCEETVEKSKKNKLIPVDLPPEAYKALQEAVFRKDSIYDLEFLNVSDRTLSVLDFAGFSDISLLMGSDSSALLSVKGIGVGGIQKILNVLPQYHQIKALKKRQDAEEKVRSIFARLIHS